jgi:hypothetical protein
LQFLGPRLLGQPGRALGEKRIGFVEVAQPLIDVVETTIEIAEPRGVRVEARVVGIQPRLRLSYTPLDHAKPE